MNNNLLSSSLKKSLNFKMEMNQLKSDIEYIRQKAEMNKDKHDQIDFFVDNIQE